MALSGLDIFKQLPKTNCKECGMSTCLAFAMALASGKTSLDKCLHVSEKAKGLLDAAFAPAMQSVKIGVDPNQITLGGKLYFSVTTKPLSIKQRLLSRFRILYPRMNFGKKSKLSTN